MLGLFAKPKRRSRSSGGGKMLDTVLAVAVLGGVVVVGYYVLRSEKGVSEGLQSLGDAFKSTTDAGNSTGEAIGNFSCHIQNGFSILTGGLLGAGPQCRGWNSGRRSSPSPKTDEDSIIEKLKDAQVEKYQKGPTSRYFDWFDRGQTQAGKKDDVRKQNERAAATQKGVVDWFMGLGCGTLRAC